MRFGLLGTMLVLMNAAEGAGGGGAGAGGGTGGGGTGGGSGPWYGSLPDADKQFVEGKGFKEPKDILESYRNLEKAIGTPKERLLRLPEKADDPAWKDVHARLGKPEKPDDYEIPVPEGDKGEFAKFTRGVFHEANLSKEQAKAIATKWNEHFGAAEKAAYEKVVGERGQQIAKIKTEWGTNYDANVATVNKVAAALGLTEAQYHAGEAAFGADGWLKMLHSVTTKFGVKLEEANFRRGDGAPPAAFVGMGPEQAKERFNQLQADSEWVKRWMSGDVKAVEEFEELHKIMFPGNREV